MSTISAHGVSGAELTTRHRNTYAKVGEPFLVEARTRGLQLQPQLTPLTDGFVAIWTDDDLQHCEIGGSDVRAKRFNTRGEPLGAAGKDR